MSEVVHMQFQYGRNSERISGCVSGRCLHGSTLVRVTMTPQGRLQTRFRLTGSWWVLFYCQRCWSLCLDTPSTLNMWCVIKCRRCLCFLRWGSECELEIDMYCQLYWQRQLVSRKRIMLLPQLVLSLPLTILRPRSDTKKKIYTGWGLVDFPLGVF